MDSDIKSQCFPDVQGFCSTEILDKPRLPGVKCKPSFPKCRELLGSKIRKVFAKSYFSKTLIIHPLKG